MPLSLVSCKTSVVLNILVVLSEGKMPEVGMAGESAGIPREGWPGLTAIAGFCRRLPRARAVQVVSAPVQSGGASPGGTLSETQKQFLVAI